MELLPEHTPKKRTQKPRKKITRRKVVKPPHIIEQMKSPERQALRMAGLRRWMEETGRKPGRIQGKQDGVTYAEFKRRKAAAIITAEKALKIMAEKNIWTADNDKAEAAMRAAIEVMETQQGTTDSKLKAAKLILEFTQTKPVVKNETTLKSA